MRDDLENQVYAAYLRMERANPNDRDKCRRRLLIAAAEYVTYLQSPDWYTRDRGDHPEAAAAAQRAMRNSSNIDELLQQLTQTNREVPA